MKFIFLFFLFTINAFAIECEKLPKIKEYKPLYAQLFSISYYDGFKILISSDDRFVVATKKLDCTTSLPVLQAPAKRIITTSTTHLNFLEMFSDQKLLVGFPGTRYIYDKTLRSQKIKNINYDLNPEELMGLKADMIMAYSANLSSPDKLAKFRKLNLPIVLNYDFKEKHPLARAEWLVFSSVFTNNDEEAQKLFKEMVAEYDKIKFEAMKFSARPEVLVGDIQNGKWATCGGESDLAILIHDAGGELFVPSKSAETQFVSLEKVLVEKNFPAIWLTQNTWTNSGPILKDSRYKKFIPAKKYNNNKQTNAEGFNNFWEMGVSKPHLLLHDIYMILHNSKNLKRDDLSWYQELK